MASRRVRHRPADWNGVFGLEAQIRRFYVCLFFVIKFFEMFSCFESFDDFVEFSGFDDV